VFVVVSVDVVAVGVAVVAVGVAVVAVSVCVCVCVCAVDVGFVIIGFCCLFWCCSQLMCPTSTHKSGLKGTNVDINANDRNSQMKLVMQLRRHLPIVVRLVQVVLHLHQLIDHLNHRQLFQNINLVRLHGSELTLKHQDLHRSNANQLHLQLILHIMTHFNTFKYHPTPSNTFQHLPTPSNTF